MSRKMNPKKDNRGGAGRGQGRKFIPYEEKKVPVAFQIKRKHIAQARGKLQPFVDEINSSNLPA